MEFFTLINYKPEHIKAVYFTRQNKSLTGSVYTRLPLIITTLTAALSLLTWSASQYLAVPAFLFWVMLSLFFFSLIYTVYRIVQFLNWKNSILKYIAHISRYKRIEARFNDQYFSMSFDDNCYSENWNNILSVTLQPDHISLVNQAGETYLIPAASVKEEYFNKILSFVRKKTGAGNVPANQPGVTASIEQLPVLLLSLSTVVTELEPLALAMIA